jgi:hypothetical protein
MYESSKQTSRVIHRIPDLQVNEELLQWMTAPLDGGELPSYIPTIQASHIGVEVSKHD